MDVFWGTLFTRFPGSLCSSQSQLIFNKLSKPILLAEIYEAPTVPLNWEILLLELPVPLPNKMSNKLCAYNAVCLLQKRCSKHNVCWLTKVDNGNVDVFSCIHLQLLRHI